ILDTMQLNNNEDRILADIIVDGITYDSVGVRFKGNSSYHPDRIKNPFNIEIDFVKNQDIYGVEKLKLSNMFKDPSCIREVLSYEILQNYMPASKANFVFLYINDAVHGLYTNVESVSKDFINGHFGSKDNSFFKCDPITITGEPEPPPPGCLPVTGIASPLIIMGDDSVCYQQSYEIKSDYGWTNLENLIVELNENTADVYQVLNIDRALWMLVFNNIFVNLDSYTGSGHNYYIYEDDYNRFNTIVWDLNENFGVFKNGGQGPPLNLDQMIHLSTKWNYTNPQRPLINKLMYIPEYTYKYYAHYRTIYNEFLANDAMKNRAFELQQLIDTSVYNDPNLLYPYADFIVALDQNIGFGGGMIPGINVLMDNRALHLSTHPELLKQGPGITNITLSPESPTCEDTVWITAGITNSNSCYLYYQTERFAPFSFVQMLDDGDHHDGAPNDDIFGAKILPVPDATKVFYYIWSYNTNAGMFSPEKAEFDSYSYLVQGLGILPGDVVLNEFLADNDSTVPDQDGEYDDWIELYNNTVDDIPLSGMYLSDDYSQPEKWVFPDTIIPANSFLIIWADEDGSQEGLHANFKLSKLGEEIIFSNFDGIVLDSISFGEQFADTSFGRYPNGTGNFVFMPPTFGLENQLFTYVPKIDYTHNVKLYPNPATNFFTIEFSGSLVTGEFEIEFLDLFSRRFYLAKKPAKNNKIRIDVSQWPTGMYVLRVGSGYWKIMVK
ncbi:MAG: CotH kinase family protein, partial [Bacteroidales bacterium]|nr:CotH kinase family protein [Bacteroidales bacterium]